MPEGHTTDVKDRYKYLGIPQANRNHEGVARRASTAKYLQIVRQVLRSQLKVKNKIWAIKAGLKDSTEAVIMAAQKEALSTRSIKARIPGYAKMPLRKSST